MSLFPAYARDLSENKTENEEELCSESLALEAQLLASDNDEEREPPGEAKAGVASGSYERGLTDQQDYYLDRKFDVGNLRVSTLYYPGRPQYNSVAPRTALGAATRGGRAGPRARRYYAAAAPAPDALADAELAQRTRAFRDMLAENPTDETLWLRFIEFQERSRDADAALSAAGEAAARLRGSRRVRAALHRARELALAPHARLDLLRQDLAAAGASCAVGGTGAAGDELTELWLRVLDGVVRAGSGAELDAAAGAALAATRAHELAYPHILYAYGGYLRAAGLWERLVLLLELVCSMNFPPAAFPPRESPERLQEQELQLQIFEDKVISSGLPLSTVWTRVERARAAAHWRPLGAPAHCADPQRAPLPADVAELLRPVAPRAAALLLVQALRLAKVPLLPGGGFALAPAHAANCALGDAREAEGGEALLALLRAARRLPRAHPARPKRARAAPLVALFLDPPHYFTNDAGYLSWVTALWDAGCEWLAGEQRVALLCWRLRWLHALLLLLDPQEESGRRETRRMRGEARAALKRFAGTSPLPFAQFARIEHAAGDVPAARRAALHALRAALRDPAAAPPLRLYVARVCGELGDAALGAWATASAALGLAPPPDEGLGAPPPPELLQRALQECEARCDALEQQPDDGHAAHVLDAQLPAPAEWAAARARLAGPARRAQLVCRVRAAPHCQGATTERYWEQSACALVTEAAREHRLAQYARALAPLFPHNALLALACSGAPLWAWEKDGTAEERLRALTCGARSHRAALAHVLPPLLRAGAAWQPGDAARVAAACARAGRGGAGGALLHAVRLESEARADRAGQAAALYDALDRHPQHKVSARGAARLESEARADRAGQAAALYDALDRHPQHKVSARGAARLESEARADRAGQAAALYDALDRHPQHKVSARGAARLESEARADRAGQAAALYDALDRHPQHKVSARGAARLESEARADRAGQAAALYDALDRHPQHKVSARGAARLESEARADRAGQAAALYDALDRHPQHKVSARGAARLESEARADRAGQAAALYDALDRHPQHKVSARGAARLESEARADRAGQAAALYDALDRHPQHKVSARGAARLESEARADRAGQAAALYDALDRHPQHKVSARGAARLESEARADRAGQAAALYDALDRHPQHKVSARGAARLESEARADRAGQAAALYDALDRHPQHKVSARGAARLESEARADRAGQAAALYDALDRHPQHKVSARGAARLESEARADRAGQAAALYDALDRHPQHKVSARGAARLESEARADRAGQAAALYDALDRHPQHKVSARGAARLESEARADRAGQAAALYDALDRHPQHKVSARGAARLESEARADRAGQAAALYDALDRHPQHKWLAVRGAAWCPAQAATLADVLLERQLRAHTLLDELAPPPHAS